jgi:hypothetical protein
VPFSKLRAGSTIQQFIPAAGEPKAEAGMALM